MWKILLLVAAIVAVEIPVFGLVSGAIGPGRAWMLVFVTAAVGVWLIGRGLTFHAARTRERAGPRELLLDPLGCLVGGVLLIIPGFVTDALGALMLIPAVRTPVAALLARLLGRGVRDGRVTFRIHVGGGTMRPSRPPGPEPEREVEGSGGRSRSVDSGAPPVRDADFEVVDDD